MNAEKQVILSERELIIIHRMLRFALDDQGFYFDDAEGRDELIKAAKAAEAKVAVAIMDPKGIVNLHG